MTGKKGGSGWGGEEKNMKTDERMINKEVLIASKSNLKRKSQTKNKTITNKGTSKKKKKKKKKNKTKTKRLKT